MSLSRSIDMHMDILDFIIVIELEFIRVDKQIRVIFQVCERVQNACYHYVDAPRNDIKRNIYSLTVVEKILCGVSK